MNLLMNIETQQRAGYYIVNIHNVPLSILHKNINFYSLQNVAYLMLNHKRYVSINGTEESFVPKCVYLKNYLL